MKIYPITHPIFTKYGCVQQKTYNLSDLDEVMKDYPIIEANTAYIPSIKRLEGSSLGNQLHTDLFGQLPLQIGLCFGMNNRLNALEYHRTSEFGIALTDLYIMLGSVEDMDRNYQYDTSKIEIFFVPKGTVYELFSTTLHYAPCNIDEVGFYNVVILPKGTNLPLEGTLTKDGENQLLSANNKWVLAHKDANIQDAFCGLIGENIELNRRNI